MKDWNIYDLAEIIAAYIQGKLTDQQRITLEHWLSETPGRQKLLDKFSHNTFLDKKLIAERLSGKNKAYQSFLLRRHAYKTKRRRILWLSSVAALMVLGLGISGIFLFQKENQPEHWVNEPLLSAGESRAILTFADGRRMSLDKEMKDTLLIYEGGVLNASNGRIEYKKGDQQASKTDYNQIDIPRKGEYALILSDGTKVWLNSESSFKYPVAFQGKERRVYLQGEAFFEVSKNEKMPFIVQTGQSAVQVLGTSFNVRAYADEQVIYTTLVEGSVRLSAGDAGLTLQPEEQGLIDLHSGEIRKRKVDVTLYTSWKEGRFVFEDQTLEEIMNTLSRWYDIHVIFANEQVKGAMFRGNLKRYDDFDQIVKMLELTGVAHFKIDGNTITISE